MPHPIVTMQGLYRNKEMLMKCLFIFLFQLPFWGEYQLTKNNAAMIWNIFKCDFVNTDALSENDVAIFQEAVMLDGGAAATAMINYYRNIFTVKTFWIIQKLRGTLKVPTLLIWGEKDPFLPKELCEKTKFYVDDITVSYVPNASKSVHQDNPERVNELIEQFLEQQ